MIMKLVRSYYEWLDRKCSYAAPKDKMTNLCTCRVVEHQFWIGPNILSPVDVQCLLASDHLI